MAEAQLHALPAEEQKHISVTGNGFRVKVCQSYTQQNWLSSHMFSLKVRALAKCVVSRKLPLQVHRDIPTWLYFAIKNKSWDANPRRQGTQCSLTLYLNDAHTGRQVHAELDRARQTRDLVVQMNQVCCALVHQTLVTHSPSCHFPICFPFKVCCRHCIVTTCRCTMLAQTHCAPY